MADQNRGPVPVRSLLRVGLFLLIALAFLFAVQLLSEAMRALSPAVRPLLHRRTSALSLVGVSWLLAYVLLNGSVVAAIALSLFSAELIDVLDLFLLVAGSRLGAAGIVVLLGVLDFVRASEYSLPEALRLGLLTFVVSHTIYVPATTIGALAIWWAERGVWPDGVDVALDLRGAAFFEPLTTATVRSVGAVPSVLLALILFLGCLQLLDRLLNVVETDRLRDRASVLLRRRWLSLALGLVVTAVTTSVAFSMGVVVPIYNRGYIKRNEIVPYVMGASLGTLSDTLLVAVVLDSGAGIAIVLLLFVAAALSTAVALWFYDTYYAAVDAVQDRLLENPRAFAAFLASLVAVPLALVALPI